MRGLLAAFYVLNRFERARVEGFDLPLLRLEADTVAPALGPQRQVMTVRIVMRRDFKLGTIDLLCVFLRIAHLDTLRSRYTSLIHIDPYEVSVFDHERDVRMLGQIYVEAPLIFLVRRHGKLLMENRIELRKAHPDLGWADTVLADNPTVTGERTAGAEDGQNTECH